MCAFSIELLQPIVKIALKLFDTFVDMFSKGHLVELVENGFMEPLNDPVGLWVTVNSNIKVTHLVVNSAT